MGLLHDVTSIITHFVRLVMENEAFPPWHMDIFLCFAAFENKFVKPRGAAALPGGYVPYS